MSAAEIYCRAGLSDRPSRTITSAPIASSAGRSLTGSTGRSTISTAMARGNDRPALWIVNEGGGEHKLTFAEMAERSNRVANYLRGLGRRARRPRPADARQCRAAVGGHAGRDEARRGRDPGDDAADPRRPARPLRARPRPPRRHQRRQHRQIRRHARRLHAHRGRRRRCRAGNATRTPTRLRPRSRRTARRAPATRCCSISPPARRPSRSWCCTAIRAIPSAISSTMYWIGLSRATSTSTSPRRAGPSTPGAAFSRRGTPGRRVFILNQPRFNATSLLDALARHGSPRSARRRRCGAC